MTNLEIGCGLRPHKGFKTIDVEEYAHPTYLGDFRTMNFNDIEIIRAHHLLEHFSRKESLEVLKLWRSWLKTDGILIVETPNFKGICEKFLQDPYWMEFHTYGSQEQGWAFHKTGWYKEKIEKTIPTLGFKLLNITEGYSRVIRRENGIKIKHLMPNITFEAQKL